MKKRISILTCCAVILSVTLFNVYACCARDVVSTDAQLRFNEDSNFKILQISDIQDGFYLNEAVKDMIRETVKQENPDLIVLTGDNTSGGSCGLNLLKSVDKKIYEHAIDQLMSIFEELGTPVAAVFGNHDDEDNRLTKEDIIKIYQKYSCFIGFDEGDSLYGCGTYNLPVYSSSNPERIAYNLWMIDSNTYDEELGGYDYVHDDQVQWYINKSNELKAQNGGKPVYSMAFQHIIVKEVNNLLSFSDSWTENSFWNGSQYVSIGEEYYKTGSIFEMPCPPTRDGKEFSAMKAQGDVVAMFFGHDHYNSFEATYQGIDLVATPAMNFTDYSCYDRGIRVININENTPSTYETYMLRWNDVFGDSVIAEQHYNMYDNENSFIVKVKAAMLYIALFPVKYLFGYAF